VENGCFLPSTATGLQAGVALEQGGAIGILATTGPLGLNLAALRPG